MNPDFLAKLMAALGSGPTHPPPPSGPGPSAILAALGMKPAPTPTPQPTAPPSLEERMLSADYEPKVLNTNPNRLGKYVNTDAVHDQRRDSIAQARFDRLVRSPFADSLFQVLGRPAVVRYGHDEMNGLHGLQSGPLPQDTVTLYRKAMLNDFNNKLAHTTNSAEGLLAHEVGHHADQVDMAQSTPGGTSYRPTQLRQALDNHQLAPDRETAGNEYSRTNTQEYRASVIANAIQYLRDTAALTPDARGEAQAATLRQSYEQDVPGTADVTNALMQNPIYARHPLKLARMAIRPDATAVRKP